MKEMDRPSCLSNAAFRACSGLGINTYSFFYLSATCAAEWDTQLEQPLAGSRRSDIACRAVKARAPLNCSTPLSLLVDSFESF